MRIGEKVLMVNIENDITLLNDSITITVIHQASITEIDNEIDIDIDLVDYTNVMFLGKQIGYTKLRDTLINIDVDIDLLVGQKANQLITNEDIDFIKTLYKK